MERIYLDHNATTPMDPQVLEAMLPYLGEVFGNPSSTTWFGQEARRGLERARREVAELIGADPGEIVLCSGGTEANNHALRGAVGMTGRGHVVISAVEHHAVLQPCDALRQEGLRITQIGVDATGRVDAAGVVAALDGDTAVVSVMLANNDVGTLQPVAGIAPAVRARGVLMHTDAVQAVGKIPVDVRALDVDLLSLSSHKLYGPKGVGALYVRGGTLIEPLLRGGHHEKRRRAGTENVPGIIGFGAACLLAAQRMEQDSQRVAALRDRLQDRIVARVPDTVVNGHPTERLPNTLNVSFPGVDGEMVTMSLDSLGIATSNGSACSAGTAEPSHVLQAMGRSERGAASAVRLSLGRGTTTAEVDRAAEAVAEVVRTLRGT